MFIPSLLLTDLNKNKFIKQYEYSYNKYLFKKVCHWLIPEIIIIGRDHYILINIICMKRL